MSCYFRHIQEIFKDAGITISTHNKKQIDQAIHEFLGITYKDCPTTLKALKTIMIDKQKRDLLVQELKTAYR
ncbi:hypothetical protein Dform_01468 [Dehalogenimonas formicexedens]|uniref:Uncharacterized protein n=1 Tax=Dehalogenimonas formicexedens TaxID=1839801 RepID=A0A1P8F8M9_9CHLR|nr:hypothetical protein Dform_01468 [Dehalogenimonas formicexedens]